MCHLCIYLRADYRYCIYPPLRRNGRRGILLVLPMHCLHIYSICHRRIGICHRRRLYRRQDCIYPPLRRNGRRGILLVLPMHCLHISRVCHRRIGICHRRKSPAWLASVAFPRYCIAPHCALLCRICAVFAHLAMLAITPAFPIGARRTTFVFGTTISTTSRQCYQR